VSQLPCRDCLRRSWLLAALSEHLARASARHGDLDAALALPDVDLIEALTPPGRMRARLKAAHRGFRAGAARAGAEEAGLAVLCRHDARYPRPLLDLDSRPAALHVAGCGRLAALRGEPFVAVVGARRASAYGVEAARALGRGLAAAGVTVVSGMALGVDSAAHAGAVEAGGSTIAVLGGGADVPYPATKRALYARLRDRAVVLSELPPGAPPRRWVFPARNRIIAALATLTVVVEAGERSGALITARIARELGREVGAVPGRITSPLAAGTNALIRDGAHLVDGPQSVLDLVFGVGARSVPQRTGPRVEGPARRVLDAVRSGAESVGELLGPGGDPAEVLAALGELELLGLVRRGPGGRWVATS
jgi:DNA processing protein